MWGPSDKEIAFFWRTLVIGLLMLGFIFGWFVAKLF